MLCFVAKIVGQKYHIPSKLRVPLEKIAIWLLFMHRLFKLAVFGLVFLQHVKQAIKIPPPKLRLLIYFSWAVHIVINLRVSSFKCTLLRWTRLYLKVELNNRMKSGFNKIPKNKQNVPMRDPWSSSLLLHWPSPAETTELFVVWW